MADTQPAGDRQFGYWAGHFVVVASMIGAGILTTSGFTLNATGNPTAMLALWAVGGLLALCGVVTVAELATALPRSGGDYVFVREGFGRGAAFVSGWATFVIGFAAPTAVVATLAMAYLAGPFSEPLTRLFGRNPADPEAVKSVVTGIVVPASASALILFVAVIHTLGARQSTVFQVSATLVKIAILVGIAAGGILFGSGDWNHLSAGHWPTAKEWPALATGLIYVGYAYSGWNAAAYLAGEIRDPDRLLPRSLLLGAATVLALYLLVNMAYVYALDPVAMTKAPFEDFSQVARVAVEKMFGKDASNVVAVALGLSLVASVSAYVLAGPRVAFAMARDGAFPGYAGRLHPTRHTPALATWTQAALAVALIWSGTFEQLLDYTSIGLAVVAGLTIVSVFPVRRRPDLRHPYRMPLYPLPPVLFLLLTAWTVGYTVYDEWMTVYAEWQKSGVMKRPMKTLSVLTVLLGIPLSMLLPDRKTDPPAAS